MKRLTIRLAPGAGAVWASLSPRGAVEAQGVGWPDPLRVAAADEVVLVVPGEAVLLLPAPRVSSRPEQLRQALPFAVEDQLAGPVERLHVVPGDALDGGQVQAAVVDRAGLQGWLDAAAAAGVTPDRIWPDTALLPAEPAGVRLDDGERSLLRVGPRAYAGTRAEVSAVIAALALAPRVWTPDPQAAPWWCLPPSATIDLRQGDFAAPARGVGLWRWVAGLAAAALGLWLLFQGLEVRALQARHADLQAEMAALYRDAVPGAGRVVDAEAQLRDALARAQGGRGGGQLALLARAAPLIADPRFSIDALELAGGTLEIALAAPDIAALDALRADLAQSLGLPVELVGVTAGEGVVEGRLRLQGGAR